MTDLRSTSGIDDFEAPHVLADRCDTFSADPDEPAICSACGWFADEHFEVLAA
jgi:hypothetical protein